MKNISPSRQTPADKPKITPTPTPEVPVTTVRTPVTTVKKNSATSDTFENNTNDLQDDELFRRLCGRATLKAERGEILIEAANKYIVQLEAHITRLDAFIVKQESLLTEYRTLFEQYKKLDNNDERLITNLEKQITNTEKQLEEARKERKSFWDKVKELGLIVIALIGLTR